VGDLNPKEVNSVHVSIYAAWVTVVFSSYCYMGIVDGKKFID